MIETRDFVKVIKIIDIEEAHHLENMIGCEGQVVSWIVYKNIKRFKVQFQEGLEYYTSYFREDELEKIKDGE
jgi:hypothetical protein